jgi:hypothetical protein
VEDLVFPAPLTIAERPVRRAAAVRERREIERAPLTEGRGEYVGEPRVPTTQVSPVAEPVRVADPLGLLAMGVAEIAPSAPRTVDVEPSGPAEPTRPPVLRRATLAESRRQGLTIPTTPTPVVNPPLPPASTNQPDPPSPPNKPMPSADDESPMQLSPIAVKRAEQATPSVSERGPESPGDPGTSIERADPPGGLMPIVDEPSVVVDRRVAPLSLPILVQRVERAASSVAERGPESPGDPGTSIEGADSPGGLMQVADESSVVADRRVAPLPLPIAVQRVEQAASSVAEWGVESRGDPGMSVERADPPSGPTPIVDESPIVVDQHVPPFSPPLPLPIPVERVEQAASSVAERGAEPHGDLRPSVERADSPSGPRPIVDESPVVVDQRVPPFSPTPSLPIPAKRHDPPPVDEADPRRSLTSHVPPRDRAPGARVRRTLPLAKPPPPTSEPTPTQQPTAPRPPAQSIEPAGVQGIRRVQRAVTDTLPILLPPRRPVVERTVGVPGGVAELVRRVQGIDVSDAVVRTGTAVHERARSLGARAYTEAGEVFTTQDVDTIAGTAVLAHELVHVAQQREFGTDLPEEHTDTGHELEAEALAVEDWFLGGSQPPPPLRHVRLAPFAQHPFETVEAAESPPDGKTEFEPVPAPMNWTIASGFSSAAEPVSPMPVAPGAEQAPGHHVTAESPGTPTRPRETHPDVGEPSAPMRLAVPPTRAVLPDRDAELVGIGVVTTVPPSPGPPADSVPMPLQPMPQLIIPTRRIRPVPPEPAPAPAPDPPPWSSPPSLAETRAAPSEPFVPVPVVRPEPTIASRAVQRAPVIAEAPAVPAETVSFDAINARIGDKPPRSWVDIDNTEHLDQLAARLYDRLHDRLRRDVLVQRERSGFLMDRW